MVELIDRFKNYRALIEQSSPIRPSGKVKKVIGLIAEASGPPVPVGELCLIRSPFIASEGKNNKTYTEPNKFFETLTEVVGFKEGAILLMPFGEIRGVAPGDPVIATGRKAAIEVSKDLLGRVLDGCGRFLDTNNLSTLKPPRNRSLERSSKTSLPIAEAPRVGNICYPLYAEPRNPLGRYRINEIIPTGIKAIDGLITVGKGQRVGIFSGSGVGKSTLLGMIARHTRADVSVVALIGERGREVREFLENDLGPEGLARSVVVVATSDQPPLVRRQGAFIAAAIAEYFRDQGADVMFLMDSVTRFAMAQREIGLSTGEPPTTKGYTPSVFSLLPKFMERSGTSPEGSITGIYTILVEADDINEPISDACRSILDGHVSLARSLAQKGHYPAINVLMSNSRVMLQITKPEQIQAAAKLTKLMALYAEQEDLINIGAYVSGSNPELDLAIAMKSKIDNFLKQGIAEKVAYQETLDKMNHLAGEFLENKK